MIRKIIKVGKDLCLPLPDEITRGQKFKEGTEVTLYLVPEKNQILIQPAGQSTDLGEINLEFAEQVSTFIRDYKPALDELSKLEE